LVVAPEGELGSPGKNALFGIVRIQNGTSLVIACAGCANRAQRTDFSRRAVMANREQRSNREKKKPKSDKKGAPVSVKAPAYVEPQLIRKPHKGKQEY
jgi:hypothetical protein